jgi:hypothetical protein
MGSEDLDKLARGLTDAQRQALLSPHWGQRVPLLKTGLVYWSRGLHGRQIIKFRPLGLALRAHIERTSNASD